MGCKGIEGPAEFMTKCMDLAATTDIPVGIQPPHEDGSPKYPISEFYAALYQRGYLDCKKYKISITGHSKGATILVHLLAFIADRIPEFQYERACFFNIGTGLNFNENATKVFKRILQQPNTFFFSQLHDPVSKSFRPFVDKCKQEAGFKMQATIHTFDSGLPGLQAHSLRNWFDPKCSDEDVLKILKEFETRDEKVLTYEVIQSVLVAKITRKVKESFPSVANNQPVTAHPIQEVPEGTSSAEELQIRLKNIELLMRLKESEAAPTA